MVRDVGRDARRLRHLARAGAHPGAVSPRRRTPSGRRAARPRVGDPQPSRASRTASPSCPAPSSTSPPPTSATAWPPGSPSRTSCPAAVVGYIERARPVPGRGGVSGCAHHRAARRHELGVQHRVRAHHQHRGPARPRWRPLGQPAAALLRLRRHRAAPGRWRLGRAPASCWPPTRAASRTPGPSSSCSAPTPCTDVPRPSRPPSTCPSCTSRTPRPTAVARGRRCA